MTLREFLTENKKKVADMARDIGLPHMTVLRWANCDVIPNAKYMQKIFEYTGGLVTANDFYNIKNGEK